ncbi:MAG TPA: 30S ribosomal protein S6 [Candidatus Paceibacterota bacterium]|nr:30S ribosomal protein S6 [Candidatus Paceibacterota bacterium]
MAEDTQIKEPQIIEESDQDEGEARIYELGFLLVPTVAAENVGAEFSKIKSLIEEKGGKPLSEDFPKMRPLAYSISKTVKAVKQTHDRAYFSWIKFEADSAVAIELKKAVENIDSILRFIILKTIRENILYTPRPSYLRSDPNRVARRNKEEKEKAEKPISEAELDKTIEELVI